MTITDSTIHFSLGNDEAAPIFEGGDYEMSFGMRKLIGDYLAFKFNGDLVAARTAFTKNCTPAQIPHWELRLKDAASAWATEQSADMPITTGQREAANHYLAVLLGRKERSVDVVRQLAEVSPVEIAMLRQGLVAARTQGDFQNVRGLLEVYVPALIPQRKRPEAELTTVIEGMGNVTLEEAFNAVQGQDPEIKGDNDPF